MSNFLKKKLININNIWKKYPNISILIFCCILIFLIIQLQNYQHLYPILKSIIIYFFNITEIIDIMIKSIILWFLLFFITSILCLIFNYNIGFEKLFFINIINLLVFFINLSIWLWLFYTKNNIQIYECCTWVFINNGDKIDITFIIDNLSFNFMYLTTTIALFVYVYAYSYFRDEPSIDKFMIYICLFVASMIFFVLSNNLIMLLLGWELIGLTSFMLINFWVNKVNSLKAAFKAFTLNKLSDCFIYLFIISVYNFTNTTDITIINEKIKILDNYKIYYIFNEFYMLDLICLFLITASFIKSAQIGFHIWLPDSMEAPVPASSLIHSATLVSAGVFLILRFNILIEMSSIAKTVIIVIGSITAFYGGIVACFQSDVKRILAYSTISHCGFLIFLTVSSTIEYTLFYLNIHGFFKALVFMCIGNVIRISNNYQDFRNMGGYYYYLPFDYILAMICLFNLSGMPFSFGFLIKHQVILSIGDVVPYIIYPFLIIGALSSLLYSYKLFFYIFYDLKKNFKNNYSHYNNKHNKININYFTNSSMASNFSIFGLWFLSSIIIIYLYFFIYKYNYNLTDITIHSSFSNSYEDDLNFIHNAILVNYFIIYIVHVIYYILWRNVYFYTNSIELMLKLNVIYLIIYVLIFYF